MSNRSFHQTKPLVTHLTGARSAPTDFAGEANVKWRGGLMITKKCPRCGYQFTLRAFMRMWSWQFECPACGVGLYADAKRQFGAILVVAPLMAFTISSAFSNPVWWLLLPVVGVVSFYVHYAFLKIGLWNGGATTGRSK